MVKEIIKSCIRSLLALSSQNKDTLTVLAGPLRGKKILRHNGLTYLGTLFGQYEKHYAACFVDYAKNVSVIYDIGANTGYFSLLASTNDSAKILAFEPVPAVTKEFRKLMSANNLKDRVTLFEIALSDQSGEVMMVTPGGHEMNLMESALRGQKVDMKKGVKVPMMTLDELVFVEKQPPPQLIKLDVEGAEGLVLKGAVKVISTYRPIILIEVHGKEPANEVWDFACSWDYQMKVISPDQVLSLKNKELWMSKFSKDKWNIEHVALVP